VSKIRIMIKSKIAGVPVKAICLRMKLVIQSEKFPLTQLTGIKWVNYVSMTCPAPAGWAKRLSMTCPAPAG